MGKIKNIYDKYLSNEIVFCFVWAIVLNLFIETLARKGIGIFSYVFENPIVFLYNTLIILATLIVTILFKRKTFFRVIISSVWIAIGVTNGIILTQRMTPFTVKDLNSITDGATIITNYFSVFQLILMGLGILLVIAAFVVLWFKGPKISKRGNIKRCVLTIVLTILVTFGATAGLNKINVLNTFFGNLAYAYEDYGVPYCFINTWLNTGIHKPMGYSEESVKSVFNKNQYNGDGKMTLVKTDDDQKYPNILFLQLESFVDPKLFNNIELSKDPIPNFRKLLKTYSSGNLTVPACGAGTANTEFEAMTGISVKFFGPGEYPFKSVLRNKSAESIVYDLKNMGFSTHAIHNHRALFYNRNEVFANIGFDTFTSLEYMSDVPKTPKNWAKDKILTEQIMTALKSTKNQRDYIYTISVQGHGKYPTEQLIKNPKIEVTKAPSDDLKWKYEYYVNQIYEMDKFIKDLTDTLSDFDEPVVLVMYGDHIPALDVTESSYDAKNLYQTQYVIWSNYEMKKKDGDLAVYQLTSNVLDRIGIHEGTIVKYQQSHKDGSKNYLSNLKMLAYDMLYGKGYIYGGENPYQTTDMKMGVKKISIDRVVGVGGKYYIKGNNFTEYSKITLNGKTLKTIYLSPSLLGLQENVNPQDADDMKVSQIDRSNKEIISSTE